MPFDSSIRRHAQAVLAVTVSGWGIAPTARPTAAVRAATAAPAARVTIASAVDALPPRPPLSSLPAWRVDLSQRLGGPRGEIAANAGLPRAAAAR